MRFLSGEISFLVLLKALTFYGHGCSDGKVSFALSHQDMGLKVLGPAATSAATHTR
jgi:hypothetical protein